MPNRRADKKPSRETPPHTEPMLQADDVRTMLLDLSSEMAPADVAALVGREQELRQRAATLTAPQLALLRDQLALALECLRDHVKGTCPQIPYSTISLLAAGVCYFADELDLVPDFLPRIGRLDDGAVMAMAFQLGAEGVRRYCTATGRDADAVLGVTRAPHVLAPAQRRPSSEH